MAAAITVATAAIMSEGRPDIMGGSMACADIAVDRTGQASSPDIVIIDATAAATRSSDIAIIGTMATSAECSKRGIATAATTAGVVWRAKVAAIRMAAAIAPPAEPAASGLPSGSEYQTSASPRTRGNGARSGSMNWVLASGSSRRAGE